MAKRQFDLSAMMETVSKLDTNPGPQVQMIPLDDILTNKANFYKVDKPTLKPLADSIAMDGLQQYPVVMPHPKQAGKYLLLSGHRRCAAIRMLVEDKDHPREDLRLVPCTVKQYQSEAMAELQLILANSTARVLTNAEISKQAERMEILLYQLKEEGYEFPGRMRDQVAAACKVSAPKLARLKVIREKLKAPEFLLLFEKDKLPEQTAYTLARLPEEFQKRLAGITTDLSGNTVELILQKYNANVGWRWEPDMKCPNGKACKRGDSFLRHDLEHPFEMCGGKKCCLDCSRAKERCYPCDRMCSKAQAVRKEERDAQKAEQERISQKYIKIAKEGTQANAQRILRAIDAAGLADEEIIHWDYISRTVGEIRKFAAGEFPDDWSWQSAKLAPDQLRSPAETASLLGCSTDYLLGLTDDLTPGAGLARPQGSNGAAQAQAAAPAEGDAVPAEVVEALVEELSASGQEVHPVWLPGHPEKSGPVAARFVLPGGGPPMVDLFWFDAKIEKYRFSETGATIDAECTGWLGGPGEE